MLHNVKYSASIFFSRGSNDSGGILNKGGKRQMGNMIAYVEVTWNEKENNNNFGYRFEVPIPLTFTTESEAAKKKFAFFIRKILIIPKNP
jgi:hypothetical protein